MLKYSISCCCYYAIVWLSIYIRPFDHMTSEKICIDFLLSIYSCVQYPGGTGGIHYVKFTLFLFNSVQSLSRVWLFVTPWIAAHQASLSITNSRSSLKLTSIESVMSSSHLILCHPLFLLPPIPPSIRVFYNESTLHMRWPKYWSFSFSISPTKNAQDWSPLEWTGWLSLQAKGLARVFSNTTVPKHQFFGAQLSSQSNSHIHTWPLEKS